MRVPNILSPETTCRAQPMRTNPTPSPTEAQPEFPSTKPESVEAKEALSLACLVNEELLPHLFQLGGHDLGARLYRRFEVEGVFYGPKGFSSGLNGLCQCGSSEFKDPQCEKEGDRSIPDSLTSKGPAPEPHSKQPNSLNLFLGLSQ